RGCLILTMGRKFPTSLAEGPGGRVPFMKRETHTPPFWALALSATLACACASTHATPKGSQTMLDPNQQQKAIDLIRSIETGDQAGAAAIDPARYMQHNLAVGDGIQGFAALLQQLPKGSARALPVRAFQDGDMVFMQTEYNFFGPKIGFDVFRFENGK